MKKLFKFLTILIVVLVVLVVIAAVAGYVMLKNFDANQYKPQIVKAMTEQLGRDVSLGDISLRASLSEGARLQIADLEIQEHPDFGSETMVKVKSVEAEVAIMPFVQSRSIVIPRVVLHSPQISLVKNREGVFNVQSVPALNTSKSAKAGASSATTGVAAVPAIAIDTISVEDATISYLDLTQKNPVKMGLNQVVLMVQGFALDKAFDVHLNAAVLSQTRNVSWDSRVKLNVAQSSADLSDVRIQLDADHLPLALIKLLPAAKDLPIPSDLGGQWVVTLDNVSVSEQGINNLDQIELNCDVNNGRVVMKEIAPGVSFAVYQLDAAIRDLGFQGPFSMTSSMGYENREPNLKIQGQFTLGADQTSLSSSDVNISADLNKISFQQIQSQLTALKDIPLPEQLSGQADIHLSQLKLDATGLKDVRADVTLKKVGVDFPDVTKDVSIKLKQMDLTARGVSLKDPFDFKSAIGYESDTQNVKIEGRVELLPETNGVRIQNMNIQSDLSTIPLAVVEDKVRILKGIRWPQKLAGNIDIFIRELISGSKGVESVRADIGLINGMISARDIMDGVSLDANAIELKIRDFTFGDLFDITAQLGYESSTPNVTVAGQMLIDPRQQVQKLKDVRIQTNLTDMPFSRIKSKIDALKDVMFPDGMSGDVEIIVEELTSTSKGVDSVLADIQLKDGAMAIQEIVPGIDFDARQIEARISQIQFDKPFGFDISLAYLNDTSNIKTRGTMFVDQRSKTTRISDSRLEIDLAALDIQKVQSSMEALKDTVMPKTLAGQLAFDVKEVQLGEKGLESVTADGSLRQWKLELEQFPQPVSGTDLEFELRERNLKVKPNTMQIGRGTIDNQFSMTDYMGAQQIDGQLSIKDVDLVEVVDQTDVSNEFQGLVSGQIKARGSLKDLNSITGDGQIVVNDAVIRDINFLNEVLNRISFVPDAARRVRKKLSPEHLARLEDPDTHIRKAMMNVVIQNGAAALNPLVVESDDFIFSGLCQAGFDMKYSADGQFRIPADLSTAFNRALEGFNRLYNDQGEISLPVKLKGPPLVIEVTEIFKDIIRRAGETEIRKLLDKAIGNKAPKPVPDAQLDQSGAPPVPGEQPAQQSGQPEAQPKSLEEIVVDEFLDVLFK